MATNDTLIIWSDGLPITQSEGGDLAGWADGSPPVGESPPPPLELSPSILALTFSNGTPVIRLSLSLQSASSLSLVGGVPTVQGSRLLSDFWTYGPNDDENDPGFRSSKILMISPEQGTNYVLDAIVSIVSGTANTFYPLANIKDGKGGTVAKLLETTGSILFDLGSAVLPSLISIINHNIDEDLVISFEASNSPSMTPLTLSGLGFASAKPICWLDLRDVLTTPSRYFKLTVTSNSQPIAIGEVVIGSAITFEDGGVEEGTFEKPQHFFVNRAETEEGLSYKVHSGARQRTLRMNLSMFEELRDAIQDIFDDVGATGQRVLVVPNTRKNDAYFIDWPSIKSIGYPQSDLVTKSSLDLPEESFGVL